jgi:hypothetical protein
LKEVHMKMVIVPAAAVLLACAAQVVLAAPAPAGKVRGKERAALEQKLIGAWEGRTGCAGNFLFRADGTYELTGYGPGANHTAGTWEVRRDALPPTLVLTCKTSELEEEVCKTTEAKLIRLDDESLAVKRANQTADCYARVKR